MHKLLVAALLGMMLVGIGCKDGKMPWDKKSKTEAAATDDCAMCPGVQSAKADGTCPKCGMKVKG